MRAERKEKMEQRILDKIDAVIQQAAPELKELALKLHANPELGHEEFKACQWQVELLRKYGFEAADHYCDIPTAYHAVYRGAKPGVKIAMLTEYDALAGLGHACGHNLIAMVGVGSGIAIRELVDEYGGEIHVIGCPAEETAGAKVPMAAKGAFDGFDVAMMAHPGHVDVESCNTLAIQAIKVEFFGRPAHAAGAPETGLNALDAMINFFNLVNALRQQTKPDARIHGIITKGGSAVNVIPDYTEAIFNIRSNKVADVKPLTERVKACAQAAALGTGCTVKISKYDEDFMDTCTNVYLSDLACEQMEALGHSVLKLGNMTMPGSSDVGDVSYHCPAIQLSFGMGLPEGYVGSGNPFTDVPYGPHTKEFAAQACRPEALNNGLDFVKGFAMTACKLMTEPEHLEKIKAEFNREVAGKLVSW